jgi:putative heme utilization carrier protein HutX
MNAEVDGRTVALGAALVDLRAKPDGVLEQVAERHGLSIADVLRLLPTGEAVAVAGDRFAEIWSELGSWGEVLFLLHGVNGVFEIRSALPPGTFARGFFNIHGETPLGGHIRADRCRSIVFVDRPFFGRRSCSLWFLDGDGAAMFKVFVARDAARDLDADQLARFEDLRARAVVEAGKAAPD